jgi:hypothetical protein
MFTKFFSLPIALLVMFAVFLLPSQASIAGQSTYVGSQRFMPMPPPARVQQRTQLVTPEAKFMPLDPARMPQVRLVSKPTLDSVQPSEVPPRPASAKTSNVKTLSPEQAQQLLSIYNQSK